MKKMMKVLAVFLAAVLLTGCSGFRPVYNSVEMVKYEEMDYVRPDLSQMRVALDAAIEKSQGEDCEEIITAIYTFYDEYDAFYTNYALADIRSCCDLTDIYWGDEYSYCLENVSYVDAMLEELYYALADSRCREELEAEEYFGEGYFDAYDGESVYDEGYLALMEQEAALISRYYDLSSLGAEYEYGSEEYYDACGNDMMELLVELIALRQQVADYCGYEDYPSFANDYYFYRDYTMDQSRVYLEQVAQHLAPIYRWLDREEIWMLSEDFRSEKETFAFVKQAAGNMGGTIQEAFELMERAGLYDMAWSPNKYATSFEIYLPSYYEPFVFMNPGLSRYDSLTFAHEFGHFCNDYASYGSYAGVDVLEFFSQGMEYLSLCYGEETEDLKLVKMADSLGLYVEQSAFARFEERMYALEGDELNVQNLCGLYEEVALEFGFDAVGYDPREFVTISHFYTSPMYILSYVFSNDAAMQLYEKEQEEAGAGLKLYEENLASQEVWFLTFLDTVGLESPFEAGRVEEIAAVFREALG